MAKYVFQLRRGWKYNSDPATGQPRNDWATYEAQADHMKPLEGELVLEYDNGIPRLKIGDGVHEFSALPYMSVDSFILPKTAQVYLDATRWEPAIDEDDDRYYQVVTVQNAVITSNSKVDLTPNATQLDEFHELDTAFVAENDGGTVSVFCIGQVPTKSYIVDAIITEVTIDG